MKYTIKIKLIAGVLFCFAAQLISQDTVEVTVSGSTFSPKDVSVQIGDVVKWVNIGGSHNVNGSTEQFASNPVSFGNDIGEGWEYTFTFDVSGIYDYQCDVHAASGMNGTVTVNNPLFVKISKDEHINISAVYDNAYKVLIFRDEGESVFPVDNIKISVYNILGNEVYMNNQVHSFPFKLNVQNLKSSIYIYRIVINNIEIKTGRLFISN